jgi:lipase maturation factor 1
MISFPGAMLESASSVSQTVLDACDTALRWVVGSGRGSTYSLTRWVFCRALGLVFLVAFVSLWIQVKGLIGSQGILPAQDLLRAAQAQLGPERYRLFPTVLWVNASDTALNVVCALGTAAAVALVADLAPTLMLVVLWVLYLSLTVVGRDFLSFQWDVLLLEAALLALFVAPRHLLPGEPSPVPALGLVLLWWLLFRLSFASGLVKLTWGDPTWRHLTALDYHFWTQPLPTWTAWFMQRLPEWWKRLSVLGTFVLEIGFPLLLFGPRPLRLAACAGIVLMQLAIFATGNYTFFNLLTIALALLLVDDHVWMRILPGSLVRATGAGSGGAPFALPGLTGMALGALLLVASTLRFVQTLTPGAPGGGPAARVFAAIEPFRSINGYGLFRVMTTARREIVVEGSDDGSTWRAYEFKFKPGDVRRRPAFVEPHQPRLDWQMWFAALSAYEVTPWFQGFLVRLLQGSPDVLRLLAANPFPDRPPRYVRALLYDYRFTTPAQRRATGAWWTRTLLGSYSPVVSLP